MLDSFGRLICICAATVAVAAASGAHAGMERDLAMCTAAEGLPAAAACTRVMNSGRLRDEDLYIGYFNRADAYERAGDFDKALADIEKSMKLKPRFPRAYAARAFIQDDLGATTKALDDLAQAIALEPNAASGYLSRASLLRGSRDFSGALADLQKAGDLGPKLRNPRLERALVLAESGDDAAATAASDAVFAEGTPDAQAFYVRAAVAFAQDRLDAAQSDLQRALDLRATFAAAHTLLGRVHEKRGNAAAAKTQYDAAVASVSGDFDRHLAKKTARARLKALGGGAGNVALNVHEPAPDASEPARKLGCKRFLPATGTIIPADCDE